MVCDTGEGDPLEWVYDMWDQVQKETIKVLGEDEAYRIQDWHASNIIDMIRWHIAEYDHHPSQPEDILALYLLLIRKDIQWLQFVFLRGNYPMVYRTLRYYWEAICQGYRVHQDYPNASIDEQMAKVAELEEEDTYGWSVIEPVLIDVTDAQARGLMNDYRNLWKFLNKNAHPSAKEMDIIAERDFSQLIVDTFNEQSANETIGVTNDVFDIISATMFHTFPQITGPAIECNSFMERLDEIPETQRIIQDLMDS